MEHLELLATAAGMLFKTRRSKQIMSMISRRSMAASRSTWDLEGERLLGGL